MKEHSIKNIIKKKIQVEGEGRIYFAEDFIDIANNEQVRLALSRLTKEGFLLRLGQGIYVYPKVDSLIGKVRPSLEDIAHAIAKRDQIIIKPTGAYVLNKLGLSTQVPMKVVYLTNGLSRKIKIGKNTITFINTTQKKMAYKGQKSAYVIQALEDIDEPTLSSFVTEQLKELINQEDYQTFMYNLKLAPRWIAEFLLPLIKHTKNV
jgi:predicted transcriptional regulator of viral defense system